MSNFLGFLYYRFCFFNQKLDVHFVKTIGNHWKLAIALRLATNNTPYEENEMRVFWQEYAALLSSKSWEQK